MRNILLMLAILVGPFFALAPLGLTAELRGRIGIAGVFLFTALGHFVLGRPMAAMLPVAVPARWRLPLIYASGVLEAALAAAVLVPAFARVAGIALCVFLVLVLPMNIDAAIRRVPFGGHEAGPRYLWVRIPLQVVLLAWTYWFTVRG
jgi:uncharacterized membrane protein